MPVALSRSLARHHVQLHRARRGKRGPLFPTTVRRCHGWKAGQHNTFTDERNDTLTFCGCGTARKSTHDQLIVDVKIPVYNFSNRQRRQSGGLFLLAAGPIAVRMAIGVSLTFVAARALHSGRRCYT